VLGTSEDRRVLPFIGILHILHQRLRHKELQHCDHHREKCFFRRGVKLDLKTPGTGMSVTYGGFSLAASMKYETGKRAFCMC